jgi:hypothetical protein
MPVIGFLGAECHTMGVPLVREDRPQHRSADKRAILRDHYLFGKFSPQQSIA